MPTGFVTVPSVFARSFGFTVSGTHTLAYAERFANVIDAALEQSTLAYSNLTDPSAKIDKYTSSSHPNVLEQEISGGGSYALALDSITGPTFTFVSNNGADTITGSGGGDTVLVAGISSATSYIDQGGNNEIVFVDGNNIYNGHDEGGADTIVAGSGFDTVTTGSGRAWVYAGPGQQQITLQDTLPAGATADPTSTLAGDYNQFAYLDDGQSTVHANGVADVVVATAPGQLIVGGGAGDTDLVVVVPSGADSTVPGASSGPFPASDGDDTIVASGAHFSVFNDSNNNAIFGGSGSMNAVFADSVEGSVVAGTGSNVVWGNAGDTINYYSDAAAAPGIIVVGSGAEIVDARGALAQLTIVVGAGNETLTGGANTTFNVNAAPVAATSQSVTIHDFGASDMFNFVNYTQAQYDAALQTGTVTSSGYQLTLSDHTTVTFLGISSLSGHTERS